MKPPISPMSQVRSAVPGIAWPPISYGEAANLVAMVRQLEDSQWLDPDVLAERQFAQLAHVVGHAHAHSAHFRGRLEAAGLTPDDLCSPVDLSRLPVLRRRDLQSAHGLFCDQVPEGHAPLSEGRTSGSTGEPVVVRRSAVNLFDLAALSVRQHLWQGEDPKGRFCAIRANVPELKRYSSWRGGIALLFETGPSLSIPITTDIDAQIELLIEFAPQSLLIYPSNLAALARTCAERGVALPGLKHIRTIGETLSPAVRGEAMRVFGARVSDGYSSEEVGYIALECPDSPLHHVMAETLIVEVLDDEGAPCREGEVGRVTVTDLRNFATPLIRYDIGDYAEVGPRCPCGRGLPTLRRILGRERHLIRMPDGTRHWPLVGFRDFREIAPIRQYQLVQDGPESIEVRLVTERWLTAREEAALTAHVQASLGHPFALRLTYFEGRIPPGANGKFEEFICAIA
jgi:phenylacetate-CoA ligase